MKAMQAGITDDAQVLNMPATTLCAEPFPFLQLSLHETTVKDLVFKAQMAGEAHPGYRCSGWLYHLVRLVLHAFAK